jgi:endonuclease YncB( thermonuclease family)
MPFSRLLVAVLLALATFAGAHAETITGTVVSIADGDTLTLLDATRTQHKIRLAGIDAPEKAQPYGNVSRQNLGKLAFQKRADAECGKRDRYGRWVCTVYVSGKDVNLAQLEAGLAWWYRKYAPEQSPGQRAAYEAAEAAAHAGRVGLWQDNNPVPPWEWRRNQRLAILPHSLVLPKGQEMKTIIRASILAPVVLLISSSAFAVKTSFWCEEWRRRD